MIFFFFLERSRSRAKLSGRFGGFPYTPFPQTSTVSSWCHNSHQSGAFVTIDDPCGHITVTQGPWFLCSFTFGIHSVDLGKFTMTCTDYYNSKQIISLLKLPYAPDPSIPTPDLGNQRSLRHLYSISCSRVRCGESCRQWSFQHRVSHLASLTEIFSMSFQGLMLHFNAE